MPIFILGWVLTYVGQKGSVAKRQVKAKPVEKSLQDNVEFGLLTELQEELAAK